MSECAFCGSTDVEQVTTSFDERQAGVRIRIEGIPAVMCRSCPDGSEPAVTLGVAKALQAAYDLVFEAASASEQILAGMAEPGDARNAV